MSNFSGYKTKSFSETQKFFVLDPNTGSPSFVNAADLVSQLTPNSNHVYAERTRTTTQATDYAVGSLVQTAGDTAVADNGAAYFLVVASGGDFVMDNGNELLFLYDDDLLRTQLATNTVTLGSDLVAHTGTTDTVTEALDKRTIYVGSVAELISQDSPDEKQQFSVESYHDGLNRGGGIFYYDATRSKSDHNGGTIIDPDKSFPDWNNDTEVANWFTPASSGSGCFVRNEIPEKPGMCLFGIKPDQIINPAFMDAIQSFGSAVIIDVPVSIDGPLVMDTTQEWVFKSPISFLSSSARYTGITITANDVIFDNPILRFGGTNAEGLDITGSRFKSKGDMFLLDTTGYAVRSSGAVEPEFGNIFVTDNNTATMGAVRLGDSTTDIRINSITGYKYGIGNDKSAEGRLLEISLSTIKYIGEAVNIEGGSASFYSNNSSGGSIGRIIKVGTDNATTANGCKFSRGTSDISVGYIYTEVPANNSGVRIQGGSRLKIADIITNGSIDITDHSLTNDDAIGNRIHVTSAERLRIDKSSGTGLSEDNEVFGGEYEFDGSDISASTIWATASCDIYDAKAVLLGTGSIPSNKAIRGDGEAGAVINFHRCIGKATNYNAIQAEGSSEVNLYHCSGEALSSGFLGINASKINFITHCTGISLDANGIGGLDTGPSYQEFNASINRSLV